MCGAFRNSVASLLRLARAAAPAASGLSYYSEVAFGPAAGHTSGLLAAIALVTGIPATALTGGRYVAQFAGSPSPAWIFPLAVLAGATAVACVGSAIPSKPQVGQIIALFALVICTAVVALTAHGFEAPSMEPPHFSKLGSVLTAVYLAFTGWETVAFTFEEHKRPDLIPRIFAASYVVVVTLCALLLLGLFAAVDPADKALSSAPLLVLAKRSFGIFGRPAAMVLVVAAITANVFASVLAPSRLVFGMARSGYLPTRLSRVRERDGNPVASVVVVGSTLTLIAVLVASGLLPFEALFILSGGIYFALYEVGAMSFAKLAPGAKARIVSAMCAVTQRLSTV